MSTNQGTPTLYEALHAAGVPLDSHESDLYVKDTPEARAILVAHGKCPGAWGCEAFTSNIEPRDCWFDVPFAFDPYWQQRQNEPGRCGGQDSHCHHYRIVGTARGLQFPTLLVRHGGGDESIRLSNGKAVLQALAALDSNGRYWLLNALYHAANDAKRSGRDAERARWHRAAAEKRIKVRKVRGRDAVTVEIEDTREGA